MSTRGNRRGAGLFGYGYDGLPGEIDQALGLEGAADELAHEIIARWHKWAETRQLRTGRRSAERQFSELATLASILLRYHARRRRVPSGLVADALDHALGVINPKSGQPVPSANVMRRYGLPDVDDMENFLKAALLDGEADAIGVPLTQGRLAASVGKAQSTIRRWRVMPQYVRRRAYVRSLGPAGVRSDATSSHS